MHRLELDSIGFVVTVKQFTLIKAIRFMSDSNSLLPLQKLRAFCLKSTNLDEFQMKKISLADAILISVYYRMSFNNMFPIVESPSIKASDLIHAGRPQSDDKFYIIGDYRFNPNLTLDQAIEAETTAIQRDDAQLFSYYLFAMCCTKGFSIGWQTLLDTVDDSLGRGQVIALNEAIGNIGSVKIDLLRDISDGSNVSKGISLVGKGGVANHAIGFQGSNLLFFGI